VLPRFKSRLNPTTIQKRKADGKKKKKNHKKIKDATRKGKG
jgi:hypothetical protein